MIGSNVPVSIQLLTCEKFYLLIKRDCLHTVVDFTNGKELLVEADLAGKGSYSPNQKNKRLSRRSASATKSARYPMPTFTCFGNEGFGLKRARALEVRLPL